MDGDLSCSLSIKHHCILRVTNVKFLFYLLVKHIFSRRSDIFWGIYPI